MKVVLDTIERTERNVIYHLYEDVSELNAYERTKEINRFAKTETKVLERAIEGDLRHFLQVNGIIPYDNSKSALESAFNALNEKGMRLEVIDRYKNTREEIVGLENGMTIILDRYYVLSIAVEVRVSYL